VIESCCLDVDVDALSDGHSTVIGDRGVTLSGGQRQRVSLARAVYSDSDIYLLDDPLASVDPDVALTVFRRVVLDLLVGKTVLLVTHHLQVNCYCWTSNELSIIKYHYNAQHTARGRVCGLRDLPQYF